MIDTKVIRQHIADKKQVSGAVVIKLCDEIENLRQQIADRSSAASLMGSVKSERKAEQCRINGRKHVKRSTES